MKEKGNITLIMLLFAFILAFVISQSLQVATLSDLASLKKNIRLPSLSPLQKKVFVITPEVSPIPQITKKNAAPVPTVDNEPWGVAKKIGEHTYTIKLGQDDHMGTPQEVLEALNRYRAQHSRGQLQWDDKLAPYAQTRADSFKSRGGTDEHAGLNDYLDHQDGFVKLGFNQIGENSYFGGPLNGVHIIEWLFASSAEHDANQLDSLWSHVGIGVTDTSVNLIFGAGKM